MDPAVTVRNSRALSLPVGMPLVWSANGKFKMDEDVQPQIW